MLVGATRFNDLARGLPGISRQILAKRLRHFQASGLVTRTSNGYELTEAGRDIGPVVFGMADWGARWAFPDPEPQELDPDLLVWWMHWRISQEIRPGGQVVVEIQFTDAEAQYWLVIEANDVSVCLTHPGFETDLVLRSSLRTLYYVWMGRRDLASAISDGDIELFGDPAMVRTFPAWLQLSPVSPAVRAATAG